MRTNRVEYKEFAEIINEKKIAEQIIEEDYMDENNIGKICGLLARYCYWEYGYREIRTIKYLNDYMIKNLPGYNEVSTNEYDKKGYNYYERLFKSAYKNAANRPPVTADGFWITKSELETIAELGNKVLERLAFCFLCYAKLHNLRNEKSTGWVYQTEYKKIRKYGRISGTVTELYGLIGNLCDRGYLEISDRTHDMKTRVTFIDEDSEKAIFINDFRELGYYYNRHRGENIIKCEKCGRLARGNKRGTKKYCNICAKTVSVYVPELKMCRCGDCGKMFTVDSDRRIRKRCDACQKLYNKEKNARMYQQRKKHKAEISTHLEKDE
jgi:hypothetical protein